MIRKDGYKLIIYQEIQKIRLYNLIDDPEELNDLAGKEDQKERIKTMFEALIQLQKDLEDPLDISGIYNSL